MIEALWPYVRTAWWAARWLVYLSVAGTLRGCW